MEADDYLLPGATQDSQSVTPEWEPVFTEDVIHGVHLKEVKNVLKRDGYLVEIYRSSWDESDVGVDQVFQVSLEPGRISAWHTHATTMDRLFVNSGSMLVVLYDARADSSTYGQINEFRLGALRPGLLTIPSRVWHGIRNLGPERSTVLNLVDHAYSYEEPDHWRVPGDSAEVPYDWG